MDLLFVSCDVDGNHIGRFDKDDIFKVDFDNFQGLFMTPHSRGYKIIYHNEDATIEVCLTIYPNMETKITPDNYFHIRKRGGKKLRLNTIGAIPLIARLSKDVFTRSFNEPDESVIVTGKYSLANYIRVSKNHLKFRGYEDAPVIELCRVLELFTHEMDQSRFDQICIEVR